MEFTGLLKKEHVEIPGVNEKQVEFLWVIKKTLWYFHRPWFLALEFPRGVTQFCGISRREALFSLEFQRVKVK